MSVPGTILVSLVHLWKNAALPVRAPGTPGALQRHRPARRGALPLPGAAFQLQDRLFLIDYESLTFNEMSQTILIPSFKSRITRLNGLKTGVSSGDRRNPACTRVVWEYLGEEINRINAYRQVAVPAG
jgi:hypothetical protein